MTNHHRRRLARVRNAFLGATALAGFAAATTPACAIVINDEFTPTQVVDTTNVTGIGQMVVDEQNGFIGLCTASLINPRTVIFASHCVNENPSETDFMPATGYGAANGGLPIGFFFNANNNQSGNSAIGQWLNGVGGGPRDLTRTGNNAYNSNFVVYDTNCCTIGVGNNFLQSDIAMAALDTPAIGVPTWTLLFSPLAGPAHATIEGYGDNGTGTTGAGTIDFKRRVAENIVSLLGSLDDEDEVLFGGAPGLPANLYMMDFNDPKFDTVEADQFDFDIFHDTATPKEGITAPGDSGGPLIVDHEFAAPTIAAVLSGGSTFFIGQPSASYGTQSFYQPLYLYWDWIVANDPYKYVTSTGGNHNWHDANAFTMALDPAFLTIDSSGNTINALPTTPAPGQADIPPGFGEVCYYDDFCVDIKTGAVTSPAPPPGPNPQSGTRPFNGLLGKAGFVAFVQSYIAAESGRDCGAAVVSIAALNSGDMSATQPACPAGQASTGGGGTANAAASTTQQQQQAQAWIAPEGFAQVGDPATGEMVQGAPGASPGEVINNHDQDVATLSPARYYDVTLAANGTTTLTDTITVDKLTINGPDVELDIAAAGNLTTNITTNVFAGILNVLGTLNSPNGLAMFGGLLEGNGTVNAPVGFLLGAIAPGTNGTIGTLTINGDVNLGIGSTTLIDFSGDTSDLLRGGSTIELGGTLILNALATPEMGQRFIVAKTHAGDLSGDFDAIVGPFNGGVLSASTSQVTAAGVEEEVVTINAGSFVTVLGGTGTPDQETIAAALDAARGAHYNDLLALYQAIDPLGGSTLGQALENLAPDAERVAPLVGDMAVTGFDNMLWQRLAESGASPQMRTAGLTIDSDGLRMALASAGGNSATSQQMVAMGLGIADTPGGGNGELSSGTVAQPQDADASWLFLPDGAGGYVSGSSLNGSVDVGGGGGRATVRGLIIGAGLDMPVTDDIIVGASFGYSDATATLRASPSTVQSDTYQFALYGRVDFGDRWIAEGFGSYGHQVTQTERLVIVGPTGFLLWGHTGGDSPSAGVYLGKAFEVGSHGNETLRIVPSVSLQYVDSQIDAFSETGGAPAMSFSDFGESTVLGRVGFDASMRFDLFGSLHLTPNTHLFWVNNMGGSNDAIQAGFAAGPSSIMTFAQALHDRSYGEVGLGLDLDLSDVLGTDAVLSGRYDDNTRHEITYGAWTGRLSIKF